MRSQERHQELLLGASCVTLDFLQDFKEACEREGWKYFVAITQDGEGYNIHHSLDELPEMVTRKPGDVVSRKEDFCQAVESGFD